MSGNGNGTMTCKLCGADMRANAWFGRVVRCEEHDAYICPVCMMCNATPPSSRIVEMAKEQRRIFEEHMLPLLKQHRIV